MHGQRRVAVCPHHTRTGAWPRGRMTMLTDRPAGSEMAHGGELAAPPLVAGARDDGDETVSPADAAPRQRTSGFLAPLRIANVRRLLAGQTVSRFGDQFYFVALPWLVLRVSDSPIALSVV